MAPPIISLDDVLSIQSHPEQGQRLVLLDVRSYLDGRDGYTEYTRGHIPGARFVDMDTVLASPASPEAGRHPLPSPEVFAEGLGRLGVADSAYVVAYDDLGGMVAGRLVWMLRIIGCEASLLDGGLQGWPNPLATTDLTIDAHQYPLVTRTPVEWPAAAVADAAEVDRAVAAGVVVVDSRAAERYRGETEPIDPRAGHIPGAINLPFGDNLTDGRFLPADQLRDRFAGVGDQPIFYCGSGVSACHNVLAMEAAGLPRPRLYVGSWSQWSNDPTRQAATGANPAPNTSPPTGSP